MKEFWTSVSIYRSYGQEKGVMFFSHGTYNTQLLHEDFALAECAPASGVGLQACCGRSPLLTQPTTKVPRWLISGPRVTNANPDTRADADYFIPVSDVAGRAVICDQELSSDYLRRGRCARALTATTSSVSATGRSQSMPPEPGIGCHQNWRRRRARLKLSRDASKHFYLFNTAFSVNTSWQCNAPSFCL